jgi:AraC-like DNA-binding protein
MYHFYYPAEALRPFIQNYWMIGGGVSALHETIFVDAQADILFNFGCPYERRRLDGSTTLMTVSNLDGQREHPVSIVQAGAIDLIGIRFLPGGMAAFLPMPAYVVSNQTPAVGDVFGRAACELEGRLYDSITQPEQQVALLDRFFLERLHLGAAHRCALHLAAHLRASGGGLSVRHLSAEAGYSIRTVDRLFRQYLGISPKFYAQIVRFEAALERMAQGMSLADVAALSGYYDQPHFTKTFVTYSGQSPEQYRLELRARSAAPPPNLVQFLQEP